MIWTRLCILQQSKIKAASTLWQRNLKTQLYSTIRPTVHTNRLRKSRFSRPEEFLFSCFFESRGHRKRWRPDNQAISLTKFPQKHKSETTDDCCVFWISFRRGVDGKPLMKFLRRDISLVPVVQRAEHAIHWIHHSMVEKGWKTKCAIQWMVSYPVDNIIHPANN